MTSKSRAMHVLLVISIGSVFLLARLSEGDMAGYDDAIYSHMAKAMLQSGDWWSLSFNGYFNPENPPMLIWLQAISMKLLGISTFAAKLPSVLCGLAVILLVYAAGKKIHHDHWASLAGMLVMLMTPYFLKYASHAMTDVPFTFFCTAAILLYLHGLDKPVLIPIGGVFIGFAILTRSVIGVIPILFIVAHLTATGRLRKTAVPLLGCIVAAVLTAGIWFGSMGQLHSDFWSGHLGFVFSKTKEAQGSITRWGFGFFKYPYLIARNYLPWAPLAAIGVWKYAGRLRRSEPAPAVLVLWAAAVILPLSFAGSKVLRYILPAFPAFSLMIAGILSEWLPESRKLPVLRYTLSGLLIIAAAFALLPVSTHPERARDAKELVPILDAEIENRGERVLLFSAGAIRWDLRNQLVWYGDHPVDLAMSLDEVRSGLTEGSYRFAVVDTESGRHLSREISPHLKTVGRSGKFVCLSIPES